MMFDTTVVLLVAITTIFIEEGFWNSFRARRPLLAPSNLYADCFLEGTKFPLQYAHLIECPTLLLMHM